MSAIEKELQKATGVKLKKGEPRSKYLDRLSDEADKMDDADFEKLSEEAQKWVSASSAEVEKSKERGTEAKIKDFKSSKEPEPTEEDEDASSGESAGETKEEDEVSTKKGKAATPAKAAKTTNGNGKTPTKPAKTAKAKEAKAEGYKGHRAGSNKEQAHKLFDDLGAEKARPKAEKLGVKASTIGAWFSSWNTKKGEKRASK